jgi:thiamine biosynthesis lipoprotein
MGTTVKCRVQGLSPALAHAAIDDAFACVGSIHTRMSFHEETSDLSRLNREAHLAPVEVHPHTFEVLRLANEFAVASHGAFDVTVAPRLVDWEFLPSPADAARPCADASWRDIELLPEWQVRFRRPLWIDLGGIAKGYAVDRALERLIGHGATQAGVNAGGDLRVHGPASERVMLTPESFRDGVPVIEIENGSIASSSGHPARRMRGNATLGPHVNGFTQAPAGTDIFVSVVASNCATADALTKAVLTQGRGSAPLLARYEAAAHLYSTSLGWQHLGHA